MRLALLLGIILLIDVSTAMQSHRKYLLSKNQDWFIPADMQLEMLAAFVCCFFYMWTQISFKNYKEKTGSNTMSWEASDCRPNFRTFTSARGYLLNEFETSGFGGLAERFANYVS